jgi:hypothetical protein
MSELHQFGFLATSLELFRERLQTFKKPDLSIKRTKNLCKLSKICAG